MLAQATPPPSQELNALLAHPLVLVFFTLIAAWLASRLIYEQIRQTGLQPEDDPQAFGWTALFSALGFWTVLTLGLLGIAAHVKLLVVSKFLQAAFDLLLRGLLVGAVLAATGALARAFARADDEADPAVERQRRTRILILGGALAVVAALGLSLGTWIMLAVIGIPGAILVRSASARSWARARVLDAVAGVHLRGQFNSGSVIGEGERAVEVAGKVGVCNTWIRREGHLRLEGNGALLALTRPPQAQPTATASPPDWEPLRPATAPEAADIETSDDAGDADES